ncbi:MAG: hypothetical protein KC917_19045, partial [Candidatus Omnitrophica bacterium]|nr:hypothetical protein [Candidatus Omnitrophota bacterium]
MSPQLEPVQFPVFQAELDVERLSPRKRGWEFDQVFDRVALDGGYIVPVETWEGDAVGVYDTE